MATVFRSHPCQLRIVVADGQAFSDGCVRDWGGGDYEDLMAGLDHALEANPWIDSERLGVCGGSCETAAPLPALHLPLVRLRAAVLCNPIPLVQRRPHVCLLLTPAVR